MPLSILLIPYVIFLLLYITLSLALVYHLFEFGFQSMNAWLITGLHISVSLFLGIISVVAIVGVNWSAPIGLTLGSGF